jgi:hypothetical protein
MDVHSYSSNCLEMKNYTGITGAGWIDNAPGADYLWGPPWDDTGLNGFANGPNDPNDVWDALRIVWWVQDQNNTYQGNSASQLLWVGSRTEGDKGTSNFGEVNFYAGRYEVSPGQRWKWHIRSYDGDGNARINQNVGVTAWNSYNAIMAEFIPGTHFRAACYSQEVAPSNFAIPNINEWANMPNECKVDLSTGDFAKLKIAGPLCQSESSVVNAVMGRTYGWFCEWRKTGNIWKYLNGIV